MHCHHHERKDIGTAIGNEIIKDIEKCREEPRLIKIISDLRKLSLNMEQSLLMTEVRVNVIQQSSGGFPSDVSDQVVDQPKDALTDIEQIISRMHQSLHKLHSINNRLSQIV